MKGKIISIVQNSVVIKADVRTDIKRETMYGTDSKRGLNANSSVNFNPNKLLNYEILHNDKVLGKISNVIGRVNDFFLVCNLYDNCITSNIFGEDVEILKQNRTRKEQHIQHRNHRYKKTIWQKQTAKR